MNFKEWIKPNPTELPAASPERKKTPTRLSLGLEALKKALLEKVEVKGRENLAAIPKGKRVIVACSHITDMDMWIVTDALKNDFDLCITNQSVQTLEREPMVYAGIKLAGRDNFFPIDYVRSGKDKQGKFNPDNFIRMKDHLESREKTPVIAAHRPSRKGQLERGGYGAALLAQYMEDAIILPVAVNVKSERPAGQAGRILETVKLRPEAEVTIGQPFELKKIEGIGGLNEIMDKRKRGEAVTAEDRENFSAMCQVLEGESDSIMKAIAQYLPEEKRGAYGIVKKYEE